MIQNIQHPRKEIVPLAIGLGWGNDGAVYQEKIDGRFAIRSGEDFTLAGEDVRGQFIAWDCLEYAGEDVRAKPFIERLHMAFDLCGHWHFELAQAGNNGGELLEKVLARGGEGIVRKLPGATYFDAMTACKRLQTWRCVVTALDYATGGAKISDVTTGEDRGTVPLRNRATACRVGSIVKVEGENLSARGMILKPRPCKDTATSWLVKF